MRPVLTHWALQVRSLDASIAFYQSFCDLVQVHERVSGDSGDRVVWLAEPGREQELILVLLEGNPGAPQAAGNYSHLGFAMATREEVDRVAERARAAGCLRWEPTEEDYPVGYYCGVADPDGRAVEFSYGQPLGPGAPGQPSPAAVFDRAGRRGEIFAPFERAVELRKDEPALAARLEDPATLLVPMWRGRALITDDERPEPLLLEVMEAAELLELAGEAVWLGERDGRACFALELAPEAELAAHPAIARRASFGDLRMLGSLLSARDAGMLVYARGMLQWHKHHMCCPRCGAATRSMEGGHVRACEACDERHFPRTDPAVMVLISHGDRCLLARQPGFPAGMFSVLAGFVEPGESLEQAVVREAREEVGLEVRELGYLESQPWPFPRSLMLGFSAVSDSEDFHLDDEELEAARWVTRDELRASDGFFVPPPFSLARRLLDRWVDTA